VAINGLPAAHINGAQLMIFAGQVLTSQGAFEGRFRSRLRLPAIEMAVTRHEAQEINRRNP